MNIDLQRVLLNLRQARVPVTRVAKEIGVDGRTLGHVARGEVKSMKWLPTVKLLDIHYDKCPEKHVREQLVRE